MGIINTIGELVGLAGKVPGLAEKVLRLQQEAMELMEDKRKLAEQVADLQNRLDTKESLRPENNRYFVETGAGTRDGPFCTACMDGKGKLIRLHTYDNGFGTKGFSCPECKVLVIDQKPPMQGVTSVNPAAARRGR